jgi:GTP cyclohydrolase I
MTIQIEAWEDRLLAQAYEPLENRLRQENRPLQNRTKIDHAYDQCLDITREHSRTFYLASGLLPNAERRAIRALYAFCRVSDDLVDEGTGDRAARVRKWQRKTSEARPTSDDPVVLAWADARERYVIPIQYATQLLSGVSRDLTQTRYGTFADLAEYCYAVASTVGLMSMHIVGYSSKEAIPYAVKLGIALQLTNILRDVAEDWHKGRFYLPQEELAASKQLAMTCSHRGRESAIGGNWRDCPESGGGRALATIKRSKLKYRTQLKREIKMLNAIKEMNGHALVGNDFARGNGHINGFHVETIEKRSDKQEIEAAVRTILTKVGEDPDRDGLTGTPDRIARMYDEVLGGYKVDPVKLVNGALFDVDYNDMVLVHDIEYFSMCEHHMLPFYGRAHVAYVPSNKVIGLSKIPRLVDMFARRLQVQERMTVEIAEMLDEILAPQGVAVAVEGQHMCSTMRGVKKAHPVMFTTRFLGQFHEDPELRKEFLSLVRKP